MITLVGGLPGSGKTTFCNKLGLHFIDDVLDPSIQVKSLDDGWAYNDIQFIDYTKALEFARGEPFTHIVIVHSPEVCRERIRNDRDNAHVISIRLQALEELKDKYLIHPHRTLCLGNISLARKLPTIPV
jgi:broad-specificity NMP kinase